MTRKTFNIPAADKIVPTMWNLCGGEFERALGRDLVKRMTSYAKEQNCPLYSLGVSNFRDGFPCAFVPSPFAKEITAKLRDAGLLAPNNPKDRALLCLGDKVHRTMFRLGIFRLTTSSIGRVARKLRLSEDRVFAAYQRLYPGAVLEVSR